MTSRICELSKQDLAEVARIHLKAFPKSALSMLGTEGVRLYYDWQLHGPHDAVALGVFQDENLAGFCFAGVFRGALSGYLQKNKKFLIWRLLTHPWLITNPIFRQRLNFARIVLKRKHKVVSQPVPGQKSFGILSIAVRPDLQGHGYGRQLMTETEAIAQQRGFSRLHLTVSTDNMQAITFYENNGWKKLTNYTGNWDGQMAKDLQVSPWITTL